MFSQKPEIQLHHDLGLEQHLDLEIDLKITNKWNLATVQGKTFLLEILGETPGTISTI